MHLLLSFVQGALFLLLVLLVAIEAYRWSQKAFLSQYLFFVRFPVLLGLGAMVLPIAGPKAAPALLDNLFVVGPVGVGWVIFFATISAWAIVYTGTLIWFSVPVRGQLPFLRDAARPLFDEAVHATEDAAITWWRRVLRAILRPVAWLLRPLLWLLRPLRPLLHAMERVGYERTPASLIGWGTFTVAFIIVLPLLLVLVFRTDGDPAEAALWAAGAAALAHLIAARYSERLIDTYLGWTDHSRLLQHTSVAALRAQASAHSAGHVPARVGVTLAASAHDPNYERLHRRASAFALVSLLVYVALGCAIWLPAEWRDAIPALTYLMALSLVAVWIAGWLSLLFDVYRVPVFTLLMATLSVWYWLWPHGHTYEVEKYPQPPQAGALTDANQVLDHFIARPSADGTLVIVATTGGGITAEYWTAVVLRGIGQELAQRRETYDFHSHVALISSVSGGTVGSMFYLDALRVGDLDRAEQTGYAVQAAGTSSLSAVTWGLAYPDFFRLFLGSMLGGYDRGHALERRWAEGLLTSDPHIGDWAYRGPQDLHPIPIFNATVEETGERLALSPVRIADEKALSSAFLKTMEGRNMSIVTAARLSASFPYVAPRALPTLAQRTQSPPPLPGAVTPPDFHSVDGGYFDNSGVFSAISVLDRWLQYRQAQPPPKDAKPTPVRRIVIVEISAFPPEDFKSQTTAGDSIPTELLGPAVTLYNARTATQSLRKTFEVDAMRDLWARRYGVQLDTCQFYLSGGSPLSWLLTQEERDKIWHQWPPLDRWPLKGKIVDGKLKQETRVGQPWKENERALEELAGMLLGKQRK